MWMGVPRDPAASAYDHVGKGLRRSDLDPNPIRQFANWFTAAIEAGIRDVNAMSLATAGADARPSVRIVLLKSFDQDGFVFFTNYDSAKGEQLKANPYAALGFYWIELDRQIRISGKVQKTSRKESEAYFHSRPVGSQLGAWVSRQSTVIDARRVLDARMAEMTERFGVGRGAKGVAGRLELPAQVFTMVVKQVNLSVKRALNKVARWLTQLQKG